MVVLPALFASLVLLMATIRKKAKKCGASSKQITNLMQSIFSFDIIAVTSWLTNSPNVSHPLNPTKMSAYFLALLQLILLLKI